MAKKEKKTPEKILLTKKDRELAKLMEKHPEETMSQVENRYGHGRERNGSDGSQAEANRLQH